MSETGLVVEVLSLGSLWRKPGEHGRVLLNTTAISDHAGSRLHSRSRVFGQVRVLDRLFREAAGEYGGGLGGSRWRASGLSEHGGIRKLELTSRARRNAETQLYLVAVTEQLAGALDESSWDPALVTLVSFSEWRRRQEVLLLVRAHAWLRGGRASAVFAPLATNNPWRVEGWSTARSV